MQQETRSLVGVFSNKVQKGAPGFEAVDGHGQFSFIGQMPLLEKDRYLIFDIFLFEPLVQSDFPDDAGRGFKTGLKFVEPILGSFFDPPGMQSEGRNDLRQLFSQLLNHEPVSCSGSIDHDAIHPIFEKPVWQIGSDRIEPAVLQV